MSTDHPPGLHPLAPEHLPFFITPPTATDMMLVNVGVFLIGLVLLGGVVYLSLHSLPERMAHKRNAAQFQLIGILALLGLLTHNNMFWLAALVLAVVEVPDVMTPLRSIARSLEKATGREEEIADSVTEPRDHV
ncbi:hypothetical protein ACVDG3_14480 [Meridianimarinicoccus sp. RP-17]|uniref:hypothetical protein n=1 Tax=Meridianimarinicoccus zhengii TaxID=2056810 RepID=UPI000DADBF12|nr:hypothetical protein [Phycocomes zhengii]